MAGIKDILTKSLGTDTVLNVVKATVAGLRSLQDPEVVAELRNKNLEDMIGKKRARLFQETRSSLLSQLEGKQEPTQKAEEKQEQTEQESVQKKESSTNTEAPSREISEKSGETKDSGENEKPK